MSQFNYDKIKPIETRYNGTLFRSRLEARWAAFFDRLGWQWIYEPADLGEWAPDFAIIGAVQPIYVEVKPITAQDEDTIAKMLTVPGEHLLVGLGPLGDACCVDTAQRIGWLVENNFSSTEDAALTVFVRPDKPWTSWWGLISDLGSYEDRITHIYEGDAWIASPTAGDIQRLWASATNAVRREYRRS
jgi:hypothetical protein